MSSELVSHGRLDTGTNKKLMAGYQRLSQAGDIDRTAYKQEAKEMLAHVQHIFNCERCKAIYRSRDAGFCGCMVGFCNPTQYKYVMMMMMMICVRCRWTQFCCVSCTKENPRLKSNALNDMRIQHAWIDDKFRPIHVQADIPRDRNMDISPTSLVALHRRNGDCASVQNEPCAPQRSARRARTGSHPLRGGRIWRRSHETMFGDVVVQFNIDERTTRYIACGRALVVLMVASTKLLSNLLDKSSENKSDEHNARLYWPEESCERESDVLDKIYGVAESESKLTDHVWFHKPEETSTTNMINGRGIAKQGSRVLYIIVFGELRPIAELTGKEFLKAWWDAVQCHRVLWKKGVYHHEVAPSNIIYYRTANGKVMTVLNDYDLSSITDNGPSGNERTGTVPFMAIYLLSQKALSGEVKHSYKHDVESFIWVLTWVCLRYDGEGKLRTDLTNRPLEEWLKADATGCGEKKSWFLTTGRKEETPSPAYADIWEGVQCCLDVVFSAYGRHKRTALDVDVVFTTWLEEPLRAYL